MTKIDPTFADELKKYGTNDFAACFNCGNCTAVCSLSEKSASFPRTMIRFGMLGLKSDLLASPEPWLCYSCGDCSETCPRQAGPGHYMAALRRYAIASFEPTGLTRLMFRSNPLFIVITLVIALFLGFFLLTLNPDPEVARWIFTYLPYEVIHNMGLAIFAITGISVAWGIIAILMRFKKNGGKGAGPQVPVLKAFALTANEIATMKRYRDCDRESDSYWKDKPVLLQPWFIHWTMMWGFIGLLAATVLDFVLKDPATSTWWPSRLLGTIAGLFLIYGTSVAVNYRIKKLTKAYSETRLADWVFLWFLWIAGVTGFWLEISVAVQANHFVNHMVFLIHTVISMELVLLFAFSKFAHAFYRPLALFFFFRNDQPIKK